MTTLKNLSEENLRLETKKCAAREKAETARLIEHLVEIENRKLYLKWCYGSLFMYLVNELGYERGSAGLRVSAVRAATVVKDLGKKIETGELSLKTIRTVESYAFHEEKARGEKFTNAEKREVFAQVANLSQSQVEEKLANLATSEKFLAPSKEIDRAVKGGNRVIQFSVTEEEYALLQQAREVLSHRMPGASVGEIYKAALKDFVFRKHPKHKAERAGAKVTRVTLQDRKNEGVPIQAKSTPVKSAPDQIRPAGQPHSKPIPLRPSPAQRCAETMEMFPAKIQSRYIPAKESHALWQNYDGNGCTYTDLQTQLRCGSKHCLQRDHIQPFALGGPSAAQNLQVLCRNHNLYKLTC